MNETPEWMKEIEGRSREVRSEYTAGTDDGTVLGCDLGDVLNGCGFEKLLSSLKTAIEALEFYSAPLDPGKDWPKGSRMEFGCGCCAGFIEELNGSVDFDRTVIGLTAREALDKIKKGEFE